MGAMNDSSDARRSAVAGAGGDWHVVMALRAGDAQTFTMLVNRYHTALIRMAQVYVRSSAVAEEVVQDTWLSVLLGIGRFEGRCSLRTWIFRILINRARTRGVREARWLPMFALAQEGTTGVSAEEYSEGDDWTSVLRYGLATPEEQVLANEIRLRVEEAVATLPRMQRLVITLRDFDGWDAGEVCRRLGITDTNQRVLLHRARAGVRRALAPYLQDEDPAGRTDRRSPVSQDETIAA